MQKVLLAFLLLFISVPFFAQEGTYDNINSSVNNRRVNFGIKGGFSSTIYLISNLVYNDAKIDNVQNNYKIGYNTSLFLRFNMGKHYIQPEVSYYINRCEIQFNKNENAGKGIPPDYASIKSKIQSFDLPILYGYNFIKQGIYGMSFFVGPKIKFNMKNQQDITFRNFDIENIDEKIYPVNFGFTAGISVYISKVFFDFRYDQIVHNISKSVSYTRPVGMDSFGELKMHRRDNMLSFSLGVIL